MKVEINSEEELVNTAGELFNALVNLRFHTDKWYREGGYNNRNNRVYWEDKTDKLIERLTKK